MGRRHTVYFGDSNTHGYHASDDDRYDGQEHWICPLQKRLGDDYLIIEEGLSGRVTCFSDPVYGGLSGLDYIHPCLMSHEPMDLLVVTLETNDTRKHFGALVAYIALGLKRLIAKVASTFDAWRTGRVNILVVIPKSIDERYEATQVGKTMDMSRVGKSEGLAQEFEEIASQMGYHYLDANTVVMEQNHYDLMRLTKEGYQELTDALTEVISSLSNS